jgi:hypothetical protein
MLLIVEQYIVPLLDNALVPFSRMDWMSMLERWLKLAVPNFYVWFLGAAPLTDPFFAGAD